MFYLGLMSGTSMDSIDAVLLHADGNTCTLAHTISSPIPAALKDQLLSLCTSLREPLLGEMDQELGERFAAAANGLLRKAGIDAARVRAIGSHGQTVYHQPPCNGKHGFTLQIGDPNIIALRTGITTVADFRRKDMAVGGQGAPLVPAFHAAVFHATGKNRVVVNIGGIANITILPAQGAVTGFDTGPGNVLMDGWIARHRQQPYDANGDWAASGKVDPRLLDELLHEHYFTLAPPKSTGRELFNPAWLDNKLAAYHKLAPADVQATLAALTAHTVARAIAQHVPDTTEVFICGGGAHNKHLMHLLQQQVRAALATTSVLGIDPDWVEAAAFAWLAKQNLEGKPGNLPSVTGAKRAVVLGATWPP